MYENFEDVEEHDFKVLVVGEVAVGCFLSSYKPTLGADFAMKVVDWDSKSRIHLQLWDVAGHERYGHMTRVFYKYAMAAFIVYDLSRPETWDAVLKWYRDLSQNIVSDDDEPIPIVLLANKSLSVFQGTKTPKDSYRQCDMNGVGYDKALLSAFCDEHGFEGWFPVSAKLDRNIDEAMHFIISSILSKRPEKERIRPGSPWYRSEESSYERSPTPLRVFDTTNGNINRDSPAESSAVEEHHGCC